MPHIVVECSKNFSLAVDLPRLLSVLHAACLETKLFPEAGLRSRAFISPYSMEADAHLKNMHCHIRMSMGSGRSLAQRDKACRYMYLAAEGFLQKAKIFDTKAIAFSFTAKELPARLNYKHNTIHDYLRIKKKRN